jgi:transposase-like protein
MKQIACPKCQSQDLIKSGVIKERQRFRCKQCSYSFTVLKEGKKIDPYYVKGLPFVKLSGYWASAM